MQLTIKKIGDASGVVLPADMLARLNVQDGDTVYITETETGFNVSTRDLDLEETLRIGRQIMDEDRKLLQKLAE